MRTRRPRVGAAPRPKIHRLLPGALIPLVLGPSAARAADAAAPSPQAAGSVPVGGDVVWWLLLILSVAALTMLFGGLFALRRGRIARASTAESLAEAIRSGLLDRALELGDEPAGDEMLTRVVLAGVRLARDDPAASIDEIRSAARAEGEALVGRLHRWIDALGTIGAVSPLLGMLGTALTLAGSLGRIAAAGDPARAADIATAAGQALGTTVLGLLLAVPSLIAAIWLRARLDAMAHEVGRSADRILRPLGRR